MQTPQIVSMMHHRESTIIRGPRKMCSGKEFLKREILRRIGTPKVRIKVQTLMDENPFRDEIYESLDRDY